MAQAVPKIMTSVPTIPAAQRISTPPEVPPNAPRHLSPLMSDPNLSQFLIVNDLNSWFPAKLRLSNAAAIRNISTEHEALQPLSYIKSLLRYDHRVRDNVSSTPNKQHGKKKQKPNSVNAQDYLLCILLSCSPYLRQVLCRKLLTCQMAIPIVLPSGGNSGITLLSECLQSLRLDWVTSEGQPGMAHAYDTDSFHIVSFCRAEESHNLSKSTILNEMLGSQSHQVFFSKASVQNPCDRKLADGSVESSFFLPGRNTSETFTEPMHFLNLRGDSMEFPSQVKFLKGVSSVVVIVVESGSICKEPIRALLASLANPSYVVIIFDTDSVEVNSADVKAGRSLFTKLIESSKNYYKIIRTFDKHNVQKNIPAILAEIRKAIAKCVQDSTPMTIKHNYSSDTILCEHAGATSWVKYGQAVIDIIQKHSAQDIKLKMLSFSDSSSSTASQSQSVNKPPQTSQLTNSFIHCLNELDTDTLMLFFASLRVIMAESTHEDVERLRSEYQTHWLGLQSAKQFADLNKQNVIKAGEQLKMAESNLIDSMFGLESLFREVSHVYEQKHASSSSTRHEYGSLPNVMSNLLKQGLQMEMVYSSQMQITWLGSIIDSLRNEEPNASMCNVGILGVQSGGKSTLLNSLFGVEFPVGAGRCSRGVTMQLLLADKISPDSSKMPHYLNILDTEGFQAADDPDYISREAEIAAFTIGMCDIIIVNIVGENYSDIVATIVSALKLLFKRGLLISPAQKELIFVHQNISSANSADTLGFGHRQMMNRLNESVANIASEYLVPNITVLSDVLRYDLENGVFLFPGYWTGQPPMAFVNTGYVEQSDKLLSAILRLVSSPLNRGFSEFGALLRNVHSVFKA